MKFDVYNKYFIGIFSAFIVVVIIGFLSFIFIKTGDGETIYDIELSGSSNLKISVHKTIKNGYGEVYYQIMRDDNALQRINFGNEFSNAEKIDVVQNGNQITLKGSTRDIFINIQIVTKDFLLFHVNQTLKFSETVMDCFDLDVSGQNWFGGPELKFQYWPIESCFFDNNDYLSKELESAGVSERYWLTSRGMFVYVSDRTPLFIHQNSEISRNHLCFEAKKALPFFTHDEKDFVFEYTIGVAANPKLAQMEAINRILKKPSGIPTEQLIRFPIWSTWVRYGRDIDDQIIRDFANEITTHNFRHSHIDIDDLWESCYGSMELADKFANMKTLTSDLHSLGFDTTLWIHPFINKTCQPYYDDAKEAGYLVQSYDGSYDTRWWNSQDLYEAAYIDFTNPAAREYFQAKLRKLQEDSGVDGFKFDAGETSWTPDDPMLTGETDLYPHQITLDFLSTVREFPNLIEIRVAQGTQDLPFFVRMLDLDSRWGWNNGLRSMIPTILLFNIVGYPFVLPDMVGGNRYGDDELTAELFIRWLQATTFMPAIQFSVAPWDFENDTLVDISRRFTELHAQYSDVIIERFHLAVSTGEPVNPPIWWLDPTDRIAHGINDEYLLGETILVAPVLDPNTNFRDIYLPKGRWIDGNTNDIYQGPMMILGYDAPLEILPYFTLTAE